MLLNGTGNTVLGNYVGLAADGLAALGNDRVEFDGIGIFVTGSGNTVGGASAAAGNVIAASPELISIVGEGVSGNVVRGNVLGTDKSGAHPSLALAPTGPASRSTGPGTRRSAAWRKAKGT